MRLWTVHPKYLDAQGLVALWREALLAQKVLLGETRGYRSHPQLDRFRAQPDPISAIGAFLAGVADEAERRSYAFDTSKIVRAPDTRVADGPGADDVARITVTEGQLFHEWRHLLRKLEARSPAVLAAHAAVDRPDAHPIFEIVAGDVEPWERG